MNAWQWLATAVTMNGRGARAADAGDNGGSVVQGSATIAARPRMRRAETEVQAEALTAALVAALAVVTNGGRGSKGSGGSEL